MLLENGEVYMDNIDPLAYFFWTIWPYVKMFWFSPDPKEGFRRQIIIWYT